MRSVRTRSNSVDDGSLVDGVGELQPFVGGGVRRRDGEIDIRCAAGLAGGAGAEDAHFAHAREAAEGAAKHGGEKGQENIFAISSRMPRPGRVKKGLIRDSRSPTPLERDVHI